jgi:glutathione S-transferase
VADVRSLLEPQLIGPTTHVLITPLEHKPNTHPPALQRHPQEFYMSTTKPTVLLFAFPDPPNAPSGSGYCQKVETFLRFTSTPYELRASSPNLAPKGKLPYAEIYQAESNPQPEIIPDSHFIIRHLISKGISSDPDQSLTMAQKAESRAFQAYIEETMYTAIVYERWCIDENYATLVTEVFTKISWLLRPAITWFIRRTVRNGLWGHGMGRHSIEEVMILQREAAEALDARLDGRVYFHGDENPSGVDLILVAFLANSLGTQANPHWKELILKSPNLVAFVKRLTKSLFPEYETLLRELEDAERRLGLADAS